MATKFSTTRRKQWKVLAVGPTPIKAATENFVIDGLGSEAVIGKETMEALHARCKEFNYEMDSVMDLSSDVS